MLCILAVFTPALFMTGAAKALFTPLALAVGFSMVASYLLSSTLVPILAIWIMKEEQCEIRCTSRSFSRMQSGYAVILQRVLASRWIADHHLSGFDGDHHLAHRQPSRGGDFSAFRSGAICVAAPGADRNAKWRIPRRSRSRCSKSSSAKQARIMWRSPWASSACMRQTIPINLIYLWNGGPGGGMAGGAAQAQGIRCKMEELKERLRGVFARELPELRISFEPSDIVSRVMSFGANTPIEIAVSGPDLAVSREHAEKIFREAERHPGAARCAVRAGAGLSHRGRQYRPGESRPDRGVKSPMSPARWSPRPPPAASRLQTTGPTRRAA